jgi:hypothetical protein
VHKDTKSVGHVPLVVYGCEVDSNCTKVVEPWMGRNRCVPRVRELRFVDCDRFSGASLFVNSPLDDDAAPVDGIRIG